MIIIQKAPHEIKEFLDLISQCDSQESIRQTIQQLYSRDCFELEKEFSFSRRSLNQSGNLLPGRSLHLVLSSDKKRIIVNKSYITDLRLYQFRTGDRSQTEDILFEPFFPGFQSSLFDIYGILKEAPYSKEAAGYRFSATHTPRIRQYIRKRFRTVLPQYFSNNVLNLDSFEDFYQAIHRLRPFHLQLLFKKEFHFVKLL